MAFVLTAAATVVGVVNNAFLIATSALLPGLSFGAQVGIANALTIGSFQLAASAATTALMTPSIGRGGSPIAFKADPSAPISGVMGRFGVGGRQLHANVWGKDNLFLSFAVALSLGPIQSVEEFTASGTVVTFPNAQGLAAATEPYINKMWQTYRLGLPTDAYLGPPTGVSDGHVNLMTEWTSAHTLPGFAQTFWTMKNNSKREGYQSGVPAPLWTLLGMKVWDPRLDSTYPGGSGSQRRTDWTTWAYSDNPYLHALAWVRGHHKLVAGGTIDTTKRLAGVGAPDAAIDIAAFVEGANVADANAWEISGEWTTADDKWQTLAAMLQAGGGVPISQGAQISCMVEAPRTSLMTVTGEDIVGSVSLNVMASRRDRPNTVIPRVRLEAHKFEEVALGAVTSSTYVTEDAGESRVIETSYRFVGLAKQGAELAGYGLANTRETLKASIPCKPYLLGLRAGDAFTVTEPELGLSGQKFVVLRRSFDPASAIVTLDVRSETDAKHAWALGQSADAPASPSLTAPDPVPATPDAGDWTVAARPVESSGVQQPGLIVTGPTVGENIGAVLIEYSTSSSGPWQQAYSGPPTIATVEINGLIGGTAYYVGVTYWSVRGVPSAQLVKGPYTAPGLTSGDVVPITPGTVAGTPSLSISTAIAPDGSQVSRLSGSWTPPTNALTYVVEIDNGTVTTQFAAPEAAIADRIVTTGPTYRYRVKALSRTGTLSAAWSSWSSSVAAGGDTTAPGVITSPSINGQLGSIFAEWTNPTDDDFDHVKIYRHTSNVVGSATLVATVLANNATLYVPAALTTYYFWTATVDRTGNESAKTAIGSAQALPVGDLAELDTVGTSRIDAGAVTTSRLATDAVTANEIAAGAVGSTEIATGAVTTSRIAAGAVTSTELGAGSVTTSRLATGAVTANEIAAGAVGSTELAAGSVTTSRLATDAVTANEIAAGAVGSTELAAGAVTTAKIAAGAITTAELAADAISTAKIAAAAVTNIGTVGDDTGSFSLPFLHSGGGGTQPETLSSSVITTTGATVEIRAGFSCFMRHGDDDWSLTVEIVRTPTGGSPTVIYSSVSACIAINGDGWIFWPHVIYKYDTPAAGEYTYALRVSSDRTSNFVTGAAHTRYINTREFKK